MPRALKLGNRYAKVFPDPVAEIPQRRRELQVKEMRLFGNAGRISMLVVSMKIPMEKC